MTESVEGDGLEVITDPPSNAITINGKPFTITPIRTSRIKEYTAAVRKLIGTTPEESETFARMLGGDASAVFQLLEDRLDEIVALIAAGSNIPVADLQESTVEELYEAIAVLIAANKDFFIRRLIPLARQVIGLSRELGLGPIPSNALSPTGTGAATSATTH